MSQSAQQIINTIARMTPYRIGWSDDKLDDAVATLNRLIEEAQAVAEPDVPEVTDFEH